MDEGIADVDHEDVYGSIPLIEACRNGFTRLVEELFMRGADPNVINKYGITPLIAAARENHSSTIQVLLYDQFEDPRCDIHYRNRKSEPKPRMNARDYALKAGHKNVAAMLATHMQNIPPMYDSGEESEEEEEEERGDEGSGEGHDNDNDEDGGSEGGLIASHKRAGLELGDDHFLDDGTVGLSRSFSLNWRVQELTALAYSSSVTMKTITMTTTTTASTTTRTCRQV